MAINVYVINREDIIREGIKNILHNNDSFRVKTEKTSYANLVKRVESVNPEIVILDANSQDERLLRDISRLKHLQPKLYIAGIIFDEKSENIHITSRGTINAVFNTCCSGEELINGIFEMVSSGSYVQTSIKKSIAERRAKSAPDKSKLHLLTNRETEVLICTAKGMVNKEIGAYMNISESTVKNYMSSIFKKLEVSDRTQAALFAVRNGLA